MGKLENKVAVVTGASSGMGEAIAKLFASEGASVVAMARRKERLDDLIKEIEADGGKAIAVAGDVTIQEDVDNSIKTAVDKYGKLDIVINNAGLMDKMQPVERVTDEDWNQVLDINLSGPMRMFRAAIPHMLNQGKGTFVTVASAGGIRGAIAGPTYTASKHGVVGLAKNVAFMYAKKGIRSNIIAPGGVSTDMAAGAAGWDQEGMAICTAGVEEENPRYGTPEEVAQIALFLVSDDASFVNGVTVPADAGWLAH